MDCLDEGTIAEFLEGKLPDEARRAVEEHVDACGQCRMLLSELARSEIVNAESLEAEAPTLAGIQGNGLVGPVTGATLAPGDTVDQRYQIKNWLGSGSMGAVYAAADLQLDQTIALKVLRPQLASIPEFLERLNHEVVLGRRITHPNVCRLYDVGSAAGTHFITMELVDGVGLDAFGTQAPTQQAIVSVLQQICSALEAAHQQGVVHRDLKPSNIMIDPEGRVKVMDFGLARDLRGAPSLSGILVGSPGYWAPEQSRGDRATELSDIYAMGVIASELFGADRTAVQDGQQLDHVPRRFRGAVRRCLKPRPQDRFASAAHLREALSAAATAHHRPFWWATLAALGVIGVGGGYALLSDAQRETPGVNLGPQAAPRVRLSVAVEPDAAPGVLSPVAGAPVDAVARGGARTAPVAQTDSAPAARAGHIRRSSGRRRRAGARRVASVVPDIGPGSRADAAPAVKPDAGPPPVDMSPVQVLLVKSERERKQRALLLDDLPRYRTLKLELEALVGQRAATRSHLRRGRTAAAELAAALRAASLDADFIGRKLRRLNALLAASRLDWPTGKKVRATFAKVHNRYFAGDYQAANRHLNTIWHALRRAKETAP